MPNSTNQIIKYYNITKSQYLIYLQQKYSLKKAVCNLPAALTFEPQLDFELLKKAIRIEIERNDAMRLFFKKVKGVFLQYFKESYMPNDFKYYDFTGKTPEQQRQELIKESKKAIVISKGIVPYEFIFFTSYDGKNGFYFKQHHLANDAGGIFIMINDLMAVYMALLNNSELPPPPGSYEEIIKKELLKKNDESNNTRDIEFYINYYKQFGIAPIYTAPNNNLTLENYRKKKKNPNLRCCNDHMIVNNRSQQAIFRYSTEYTKQIEDFCNQQHISMVTFYYMLLRTQSTKACKGENDIMCNISSGNRATLIEKRTSGMTANNFTIRTIIMPETTVADALHYFHNTFMQFYHHDKLSYIYRMNIVNQLYPKRPMESYTSSLISYIPIKLDLPDDWKCIIDWISPQSIANPLFFVLIHDLKNHKHDLYIDYLIKFGKQKEMEWIDHNFQKMTNMMLSDPNITIQTMLDNIDDFDIYQASH